MASRINYTVSLTPVNTIPAAADDYPAHDMVDSQVGGSLACQVSIPAGEPNEVNPLVRIATLTGFTYSSVNRYQQVTPTPAAMAELYYPKVLYVRNTGRAFLSVSELGEPAAETVRVTSLYTGQILAYLTPGQAMILPLHENLVLDEGVYVGNAAKISLQSEGAGSVAVEAVAFK